MFNCIRIWKIQLWNIRIMLIKDFYKSQNLKEGESMSSYKRRLYNTFVIDNFFKPRLETCQKIVLTKDDKEKINTFVIKKAAAKTKEFNGFDDKNRIKRETTGASIEYGLLKYYNKHEYFDDSIVEKSSIKNNPDLMPFGILCDVKGSSTDNVPMVFKKQRSYIIPFGMHKGKHYYCPNIIGMTDNDTIWILGIADVDGLHQDVDDNLIVNSTNDTKTGFYGVTNLIDLPPTWDNLNRLCQSICQRA